MVCFIFLFQNKEAEKQLKFFRDCVAAAFAERGHSIIEAEKARDKEEIMLQKFCEIQKRLEELCSDCLELKNVNATLRSDLATEEDQNKNFKKVVDKFYEIKQHSLKEFEDTSWEDKCARLLLDPIEMWSFMFE